MRIRDAGRWAHRGAGPAAALLVAALVASACAVEDAPSLAPAAAPSAAAATSSQTSPTPTQPTTVPATPAATPTARDPRADQLDSLVAQYRQEGWYPNAIVGVWSPQGTWVNLTGETDGRPVGRGDHTRIGSVTKTFTVTLLLQLAEQGKLSLEDPLSKYVPDMPNGQATLRQLADMTSGIPSYTEVETFENAFDANPGRTWQPDEVLAYLRGQQPWFDPGASYAYSNANTFLLGLVLEKATGKTYSQLLASQIVEPLHLEQTSMPADTTLPTPFLRGVTDNGTIGGPHMDATNWSTSSLDGAGQMVSTLDDLHVWAVALATGKGILRDATQKQRIESLNTTVPGNGPNYSYGLGLQRIRGWVGHLGEVSGYTTMVYYKPETQTTLVIIVGSNIYAENTTRPAQALFNVLTPVLG